SSKITDALRRSMKNSKLSAFISARLGWESASRPGTTVRRVRSAIFQRVHPREIDRFPILRFTSHVICATDRDEMRNLVNQRARLRQFTCVPERSAVKDLPLGPTSLIPRKHVGVIIGFFVWNEYQVCGLQLLDRGFDPSTDRIAGTFIRRPKPALETL